MQKVPRTFLCEESTGLHQAARSPCFNAAARCSGTFQNGSVAMSDKDAVFLETPQCRKNRHMVRWAAFPFAASIRQAGSARRRHPGGRHRDSAATPRRAYPALLLDYHTQRIQDLFQRNSSSDHLKQLFFSLKQSFGSLTLRYVGHVADELHDIASHIQNRISQSVNVFGYSIGKNEPFPSS